MYANELTVRSSIVSPYVFPRGLNLMSKLDLEPMISEVVPLANIAQALASRKNSTAIKILVTP